MNLSPAHLGARLLQDRRSARAPIWLFRHGLGWLFGGRVLLLEHVGRKSGEPRFVCLELVERPEPDALVIVSGFGRRAQWYRNLEAEPRCHVSIGTRRRVPALARFLSAEESAETLGRYATEHPRAWQQLRGVIEEAVGHEVAGLPMVRLDLLPERT
ncbi:nitroreductase family deazaflavin-dependent oxidoreductase [Knoellia subterranea]|uniref:Nitroreductase n=1 Tax=Knoellia subterranea KCTC 19937 TaxID=1385521 RepID=A0A0A0JLE4_9MICO|nr:nitroreductase family deazaflavin-dependent oxidoreductase [Knoellia subterranea]KGN37938.1 nitroreductase [Knoellia subterranea KCTC 19937]